MLSNYIKIILQSVHSDVIANKLSGVTPKDRTKYVLDLSGKQGKAGAHAGHVN